MQVRERLPIGGSDRLPSDFEIRDDTGANLKDKESAQHKQELANRQPLRAKKCNDQNDKFKRDKSDHDVSVVRRVHKPLPHPQSQTHQAYERQAYVAKGGEGRCFAA